MSVIDRIATATDPLFSARVAMILMKSCIDVTNESSGTANHSNRLKFAQMHLKGGVNCKLVGAALIAFNGTIQATIDGNPGQLGQNVPDGDLEFVIAQLFDNFANAYTA